MSDPRPKRDDGFYWVKRGDINGPCWIIAEWVQDETNPLFTQGWRISGSSGLWSEGEITSIDERRLTPPGDPINRAVLSAERTSHA